VIFQVPALESRRRNEFWVERSKVGTNRAEGGKYPVRWPNTRPGINQFWAPEKQRGARAQQLNPRSGILVLDR
ncbi:unnamed protein product, partial [Linum tenue]